MAYIPFTRLLLSCWSPVRTLLFRVALFSLRAQLLQGHQQSITSVTDPDTPAEGICESNSAVIPCLRKSRTGFCTEKLPSCVHGSLSGVGFSFL